MLFDQQLQLSADQAVTTGATNSTNVFDSGPLATGNAGRDLSGRNRLWILVTTTVTSAGAATLSPALVTSAAAALSGPTTIWAPAAAIAKATLVAGYWIAKGIPLPTYVPLRYYGLIYTVAVADLTAGKFSAWIAPGEIDLTNYAGAYTNSV